MSSKPRAPLIYVSHPMQSAGTTAEANDLRRLAKVFPKARVVNALKLYRSDLDWLKRYRTEIRMSSAFVFFPYRRTIGYGVYCELVAAEDAGLPVYLLSGGKLWNTWTLSILAHRFQWRRFARVSPRGHPLAPSEIELGRRGPFRIVPPGPLGRMIENRMIEYLIVLSQGRLVVYRPEADFSGTDLHVTLLHGEAVLKIQVKGRTTLAQDRQMPVQVLSTQIPEGDPKQLLFVGYDLKAAEPREWVWLVPSDFYRAHSNLLKGYYKAGLATKPTAADKWVDFRHNTRDIAWVVEEMLKRA